MNVGDPLDHTLGSGDSIPSLFAGRYRVLRPLGRGASKEVYLAHDERLDRQVALALLTRGAGAARVRREMQVTGRLGEHPHVVTVHDAGEHDGLTYLVLRPVEGGSLAARVAAAPGKRLPLEEVLRIGCEVADALAHAHAHGIVHRDVKPDNVWLDGAARAVLGDFGVALDSGDAARLTADRTVVGTLAYLSPEQARGDPATPASDLYGLGATLYELACGRPPFTGETADALIAQHLHAAPAAPSAHEPAAAPLDGLLLRLLAKDPARRAASAESVRDELTALAEGGAPVSVGRGLVGRAPVMTALRAACDEAMGGGLRVVGLAGEAGIGKTRCAEELAAYARGRGALVAWGACEEDEGAPAYWPWRRVLRELGEATGAGDLGELLSAPAAGPEADADEARFARWEGVARCLAESAARRPLALVLEDVHWADPSSLGLLVHLTRALRGAPLLVLLTHRPADERLQEELGRLGGFSGLELDGLDAGEVAQLAEAVGGRAVPAAAATALQERTRGNPLYVSELVRALAADGPAVPSGLRTIIARRAATLPDQTRDALELAAVAGTEFSLPVVGRVAGLGRAELLAALEPALRDAVLAEAAGARCRFSHAVTREVVYEAQPLARRAERHARLAEVLEARLEREPDQPVAEIAHHAVMAGRGGLDAAPALRWSREAAREARALLAYAEAVFHLDRALEALELGELGTAADRLSLLLQAAATNAEAGALGGAQQRYEQAAALARRLGDADALAQAALGYAEFQHYGEVDAAALSLLEEARERLPDGASVLDAQVLGRLAVRLDPTTEQPRRESLLDEAIAMARAVGDPAALARLLALSPLVNWRPQSSARRHADAAEVLALAAAGADREAALWAHIVLHTERFADGDIAGADRELAAYDRVAGELRRRYYRWYGKVLHASRASFDGRLDAGRGLAAEAVADNREHEQDSEQEWVVQQLLLARVEGRAGDVPLEGLREFARRYAGLPVWRALLATGEWVAGDAEGARAASEDCAPRGPAALPADVDLPCTLALLADVSASLGELRHASELRARLEPYAARNVLTDRGWAAWGAAARPLGRIAAALGDADGAAAHFEQAVALHRSWGARPWLAITIRDYAASLPGVPPAALVEEGEALSRRLGLQTPISTKPAQ
ncbi:MAG: AAA family ATPase [Solirubrobacteraceae bacterium]